MELIHIIVSITSVFGIGLGAFQFVTARSHRDPPDIDNENIEDEKDYKLLSIKNKDGELGRALSKYSEACGEKDENAWWFTRNPRGYYMAHKSNYLAYLMTTLGALLIAAGPWTALYLFGAVDSISIIRQLLILSFALLFIALAVLLFVLARKEKNRMDIAESYILFLQENNISIQIAFLQKNIVH